MLVVTWQQFFFYLPLSLGVAHFTTSAVLLIVYLSDCASSFPSFVHIMLPFAVMLQVSVRLFPGYI